MSEYTVNPKALFGDASADTLAADQNTGLAQHKSETKVWKVIGILSFLIASFGLVLAVVGYVYSNVATQITGNVTSCRFLRGDTGVYYIQPDPKVKKFPVYCDMDTDGGGWTLVAAVHENNIVGNCNLGDKWYSEQGYTSRPDIVGNKQWENLNVFGSLLSLTNDDYKNIAYYATEGKDVMVWHVPNNTPFSMLSSKAFLKYYTSNGFLAQYGGTLKSLYSDYFPLSHAGSSRFFELLAPPVTYDVGDNDTIMASIPENLKQYVMPGFLQFRAFDDRGFANALCPGIKIVHGNSARVCIGGGATAGETSRRSTTRVIRSQCGDFAGWYGNLRDQGTDDAPSRTGKSLKDINSSIFIFVR